MSASKKSKRSRKPTVDEQSEINAEATALVKGWFARGWLLRDRLPRDIFIDYEVERVSAGEPSGVTFYAQQKGHRTVKFVNGVASQRFDTKDLRYYANKQDRPVFVLMVDVTAKAGYFVFVQEWIDHHAPPGALDKQGTLTVKVPTGNRIDGGPALADAVNRSIQYMREKYPGSVAAAMRHDVDMIMARDSRFDVRLNVVDSHKQYELIPKVPVALKIMVTGEKVGHFRELFEYGRPIDVTGEGIALEGLPTLTPSGNESLARIKFRPASAKECDFEFWLDGPGEEYRVRMDGEITGGTAGILYRGHLKGAPLKVEMKLTPAQMNNIAEATINLTWDFAAWVGKCILDLPYFDALAALANATVIHRLIYHQFSFQGNRITRGTFGSPSDPTPFDVANAALSLIGKARELAREFKVRPILPKPSEIKDSDEAAILFAYAATFAGGHSLTRSGMTMECQISVPKAAVLAPADQTVGPFRAIQHHHEARIFGTPVDIGPVEVKLEPAKLMVSDEARAKVAAGTTGMVPIEVLGVGEATFSIRRIKSSEFSALSAPSSKS